MLAMWDLYTLTDFISYTQSVYTYCIDSQIHVTDHRCAHTVGREKKSIVKMNQRWRLNWRTFRCLKRLHASTECAKLLARLHAIAGTLECAQTVAC